jgi:hypothetical protein
MPDKETSVHRADYHAYQALARPFELVHMLTVIGFDASKRVSYSISLTSVNHLKRTSAAKSDIKKIP